MEEIWHEDDLSDVYMILIIIKRYHIYDHAIRCVIHVSVALSPFLLVCRMILETKFSLSGCIQMMKLNTLKTMTTNRTWIPPERNKNGLD